MSARLDTVLLVAVLVAIWQALHMIAGDLALSSPVDTVARAAQLLASAGFWRHAAASGVALALALAIAVLGGVGLGVWLGAHRLSGAVAEPFLIAFYTLPKITLYPVILLIFGLGLSAKVAFGALHGIMPITVFVMAGIRNIDPVLLKSARVLRLSPAQVVWRLILPATLPELLAGLRVGLSMTLLGTLIGEMFAAKAGIGQLLIRAIARIDSETILALTLIMFAFALAMNAILLAIERRSRGASGKASIELL